MNLVVKVKGVTFHERQPYFDQIDVGDKVMLIPQLNNDFDENAVMIVDQEGRDLGYVPMANSKQVKEMLLANVEYTATVTAIVGGGELTWGARVMIETKE